MKTIQQYLRNEIKRLFGVQNTEISKLENLGGSNHVYSFILKNEKYVIKKLSDKSIMDWKREKAAYHLYKHSISLTVTPE